MVWEPAFSRQENVQTLIIYNNIYVWDVMMRRSLPSQLYVSAHLAEPWEPIRIYDPQWNHSDVEIWKTVRFRNKWKTLSRLGVESASFTNKSRFTDKSPNSHHHRDVAYRYTTHRRKLTCSYNLGTDFFIIFFLIWYCSVMRHHTKKKKNYKPETMCFHTDFQVINLYQGWVIYHRVGSLIRFFSLLLFR